MYLATQGTSFDDKFGLIASITTLYIAIKIHEEKNIGLSALCGLRPFTPNAPNDVEEMELNILQSLQWLVHPPTVVDFTSLLFTFLPSPVPMPTRRQIFDTSRYLGELSVCDPNFIEVPKSTIAFAAIINVIDNKTRLNLYHYHTGKFYFTAFVKTLVFIDIHLLSDSYVIDSEGCSLKVFVVLIINIRRQRTTTFDQAIYLDLQMPMQKLPISPTKRLSLKRLQGRLLFLPLQSHRLSHLIGETNRL